MDRRTEIYIRYDSNYGPQDNVKQYIRANFPLTKKIHWLIFQMFSTGRRLRQPFFRNPGADTPPAVLRGYRIRISSVPPKLHILTFRTAFKKPGNRRRTRQPDSSGGIISPRLSREPVFRAFLFRPAGGKAPATALRVRLRRRLPVIRFAAHDGKRPVDLFQENQTGDLVRKGKGRKRKAPVSAPDNPGGKAGWTANDKRDSASSFQTDSGDAPGEAVRTAGLPGRVQSDNKCVLRNPSENAFAFLAETVRSGAPAWCRFLFDFDMLQAGVSPDAIDVVRDTNSQIRLSAFANRQQQDLHWVMIRTRSDLHKGLVPYCENGYNIWGNKTGFGC